MRMLFKILPLILLTGWLAGNQSAEHGSGLDSYGTKTGSVQSVLSESGDRLSHQSTPFLPARLAELVSEHLSEVEPDTKPDLTKLSFRYFLSHDAKYLALPVLTECFDSVRKLLFPFHSHL